MMTQEKKLQFMCKADLSPHKLWVEKLHKLLGGLKYLYLFRNAWAFDIHGAERGFTLATSV